jgi:hypothetical protein
MEIIQTFLFETDFNEQINYHLFTKNSTSKVSTQLRIFQKEIKLTLNQAVMHIMGERG